MQTFLFDDQGEIWDAKSHRLAEVLQASLRGEALVDYVIRNLGFVAVTQSNESLRIRVRPSVVSQTAFGALVYWLHDRPIERVLLSFFGTEWTHELVRSRDEVAQRLMARMPFKADDRTGDFLKETLPLHDLPLASPLRALLRAWSECGGKFDRERLTPLLDNALNGRFVLVEANPDTPTLYFKDIGTGLPKLVEYCFPQTINLRVEDQPDYAYGKWVAGHYRETLTTGKPTLQAVDAVISWPENPRKNYRYRRLVVPFSDKDNSTMLLGVTQIDPLINLRAKSG